MLRGNDRIFRETLPEKFERASQEKFKLKVDKENMCEDMYICLYIYVFVCMTMCYSIKSRMSASTRIYICVQYIHVKWLSFSLALYICASVHTYVREV